jgi:hypothetical protein
MYKGQQLECHPLMFFLRLPLGVTISFMSPTSNQVPPPALRESSPVDSVSYKRKFELLQAEVAASRDLMPKAKGYLRVLYHYCFTSIC